jgi:lipoprotein-anchoring transpeptidase ErfK/SrfK
MSLTNKLSDMKNDGIINDETQAGNGKNSSEINQTNTENNNLTDNPLPKKSFLRKAFFFVLRSLLVIICSILVVICLILFILYGAPVLKEISPQYKTGITNNQELKKDPLYKKEIGILNKDVQRLSLKCSAYTSGQSYIVINTIENKFYLYTNKKLIREGFCSSGSYTLLQTSGNKKWIFKTPKGKYWVRGKTTNPVWKRPDWSFVEEGSPIPSANADSRYEYGVLGDYALALGDGYMIHGTIYKRFLGMPVTHGCVRLNDEDLKVVYTTLNIGSKVYIF